MKTLASRAKCYFVIPHHGPGHGSAKVKAYYHRCDDSSCSFLCCVSKNIYVQVKKEKEKKEFLGRLFIQLQLMYRSNRELTDREKN